MKICRNLAPKYDKIYIITEVKLVVPLCLYIFPTSPKCLLTAKRLQYHQCLGSRKIVRMLCTFPLKNSCSCIDQLEVQRTTFLRYHFKCLQDRLLKVGTVYKWEMSIIETPRIIPNSISKKSMNSPSFERQELSLLNRGLYFSPDPRPGSAASAPPEEGASWTACCSSSRWTGRSWSHHSGAANQQGSRVGPTGQGWCWDRKKCPQGDSRVTGTQWKLRKSSFCLLILYLLHPVVIIF